MAALFALYVLSLATSMSGMETFSWLLALAVGVWVVVKRPALTPPPFWKPMAAFAIIACLGVLLGDAPGSEKLRDLGRNRFFLLYAALYVYLRHGEARVMRRLIPILLAVTSLVAVYGIVQHFVAIDIFRPEGKKVLMHAIEETKTGPLVVGTFNHHLTFANIYLFYACLFTSLGLGLLPRRSYRLALGAVLFLLCVWTQSRAAWIAVPVCALILAAATHRKAAAACLALCVVALGVSYVADSGFRERLDRTLFRQDDLYNLGPRTRLWRAQLAMLRDHPLLGTGWNNNERHAKEYVDRLFPERTDNFYGHAHSEFLQVLVTTGILGFAAFVWLWVEVFRRAVRLVRAYPRAREEHWIALGLLAAFVGFHIQGATQWNFGDAEVLHNVIFFWAVLAALPLPPYNE